MLQQIAQYNDLSPKLLEKLEKRIDGYGKIVRYKFDIERQNPDKENYNGKTIFPQMYTLDPAVFNIIDKLEDRPGKSKTKTIAIIKKQNEKGQPGIPEFEFTKIRLTAGLRGILTLYLERDEDRAMCMAIECHPKLKGGDFSDPEKFQVVARIDEQAAAIVSRTERTARVAALNAAQGMSDKELIQFADAMLWDSSQEIEILRNLAEQQAEDDPAFFNDLVSGKKIEYQALVKQAMNKQIIAFDPAEYKFTWSGNKQTITILSPVGEKNEVEKMAEWLQVGGKAAEEVAKKIKALIGDKTPVA